MANLLAHLTHWHWWGLAVLLLLLEILTPGTFFLFLGLAAILVGALLLVVPALGWEYQVLSFAVLAVVVTLIGRQYLRRRPIKTELPTLNRRGAQYLGRVFTLEEPVVNGSGKIRVDDTIWKISGPDCPAATRITITGVDGTILQFEILQ